MAAKKQADIFSRPLRHVKLLGSFLDRRYGLLLFVPTGLLISSQFCFLFSRKDTTSVLLVIREVLAMCALYAESVLVYRFAEKILAVQKFIKSDLENLEKFVPQRAKEIESRRTKFASKVCTAVIWFYTLFLGFAMLSPWIDYTLIPRETRNFTINVVPEDILVKTDAGYLTMSVVWTVNIYLLANAAIAFDSLYVVSCHFISTKSIILSIMLKEVGRRIRNLAYGGFLTVTAIDKKTLLVTNISKGRKPLFWQMPGAGPWCGSKKDEKIIYAEITQCAKYHQNICRLRDDLENIFATGLFINVGLIITSMSLSIVKILFVGLKDSSVPLLFLVFIWSCFQLIYFCSWGEEILHRTEEVASAAFSAYAPGLCSARIKEALVMIIRRGQKPLYLTGGGIFTVNTQLFKNVLRQTYRIFTFALKLR